MIAIKAYTAIVSVLVFVAETGEKINRKAGYGLDLSLLRFTVQLYHAMCNIY